MQQEDILNRYRHLRAISARHHNAALDCVARPAILERAKHLGLACGHSLLPGSAEEMALVFDLAVHTAKSGRSRAIDRYARAATASSDPDDALTLEALRRARFSVWRTERHHETTGLIVTDMLHDGETWLIDEALKKGKGDLLSYMMYPGEFHYFTRAHVLEDAWHRVDDFFAFHLQGRVKTSP